MRISTICSCESVSSLCGTRLSNASVYSASPLIRLLLVGWVSWFARLSAGGRDRVTPAVDRQGDARDPGGVGRGEERDRSGDVERLAEPPDRVDGGRCLGPLRIHPDLGRE